MILAIVNNNAVTEILTIPDDGGASYQMHAARAQAAIDIGAMLVQPQIGWTFDGSSLTSNGLVSMKITKLGMMQRFTVPERLGILTYTQINPSSVPAILMQNIMVATYVDLYRTDTQSGINYLVSFGLLTSARATAILTTPPTAIEVYLG